LLSSGAGISRWKYFETLPEQRPCAMLWKLEKGGRVSWLGGSAHFFCCSFEHSLRRLFGHVDTVLLEGPMDGASLAEVARTGRDPGPDSPRVGELLREEEIRRLEDMVWGPRGFWARLMGTEQKERMDLREILFRCRHWYAFFAAWTGFLERNGWKQSVDMEVWNIAQDMGKAVMGLESLGEQIASLESAPVERVVRFLRDCASWPRMMRSNRSRYLAGDLFGMMGTSAEFPTRTGTIIGMRDRRFRERMRPYVERGGTAVFLGTAHMVNLRRMLAEDGFTVSRVLPTWRHRFYAWLHPYAEDVIPGNPHAVSVSGDAVPARPSAAAPAPASAVGSGSLLAGMELAALVPEQIPAYVRAVSGRRLCECGGFPAWVSDGDIVLAAFPLRGEEGRADLAERVERAVAAALTVPDMQRITVLSPLVPASAPQRAEVKADSWQVIDLPHVPGQKLRNMLRRAQRDVVVRREAWSGECDDLVGRYLKEKRLDPGTRHIFSRVGAYADHAPLAVLYAARSGGGRLEGIAVGDHSALETAFYMFAFRRSDSPPGTGDALLHALAAEAAERGQTMLNLGLGIDEGISFFKKIWGARELMPLRETSWSIA
ncbi:MAG: TraB/GumN family protein, partial [Mailhella sp.]|nr:TraB/GumN family protein [Mailhella sp.]